MKYVHGVSHSKRRTQNLLIQNTHCIIPMRRLRQTPDPCSIFSFPFSYCACVFYILGRCKPHFARFVQGQWSIQPTLYRMWINNTPLEIGDSHSLNSASNLFEISNAIRLKIINEFFVAFILIRPVQGAIMCVIFSVHCASFSRNGESTNWLAVCQMDLGW